MPSNFGTNVWKQSIVISAVSFSARARFRKQVELIWKWGNCSFQLYFHINVFEVSCLTSVSQWLLTQNNCVFLISSLTNPLFSLKLLCDMCPWVLFIHYSFGLQSVGYFQSFQWKKLSMGMNRIHGSKPGHNSLGRREICVPSLAFSIYLISRSDHAVPPSPAQVFSIALDWGHTFERQEVMQVDVHAHEAKRSCSEHQFIEDWIISSWFPWKVAGRFLETYQKCSAPLQPCCSWTKNKQTVGPKVIECGASRLILT